MVINPNGASGAAMSAEDADLLPSGTANLEFQLMSAVPFDTGGRLGEQI
jgi:lipid A disaccharide synthetase